jgi:hypothetical protein
MTQTLAQTKKKTQGARTSFRSAPDVTRNHQRSRRRSTYRWWVHLGMIVTFTVSLVFEPDLIIHIAAGTLFFGLVLVHLVQRRQVSMRLISQLGRMRSLVRRSGRLAIENILLAGVALAVLISGVWYWSAGDATSFQLHAITGVLLLGALVIHTLRRRRRLRGSRVR